jgi:hypothetical protein
MRGRCGRSRFRSQCPPAPSLLVLHPQRRKEGKRTGVTHADGGCQGPVASENIPPCLVVISPPASSLCICFSKCPISRHLLFKLSAPRGSAPALARIPFCSHSLHILSPDPAYGGAKEHRYRVLLKHFLSIPSRFCLVLRSDEICETETLYSRPGLIFGVLRYVNNRCLVLNIIGDRLSWYDK